MVYKSCLDRSKEVEISTRKQSTSVSQDMVLWTKSVFMKTILMIKHILAKYVRNIRTENIGTSCPCSVDWGFSSLSSGPLSTISNFRSSLCKSFIGRHLHRNKHKTGNSTDIHNSPTKYIGKLYICRFISDLFEVSLVKALMCTIHSTFKLKPTQLMKHN